VPFSAIPPIHFVASHVGSGAIENSASHLRAVARRLIASDHKWPNSGLQACRLVRKTRRLIWKTRRLSRGFRDIYT